MAFSEEEKEDLQGKIDWEGFDYCFAEYSAWKEIEDKKFQELIANFRKARKEFITYLQEQGIIE